MPAIITENDESQWSDDTGVLYHFPKRYKSILEPGTAVIYYKGRIRDARYAASRSSEDPHYFGAATIGAVYPDPASSKGDLFATIDDFKLFPAAVPLRAMGGSYFERIPENRAQNYWRDGVRSVTQTIFDAILTAANMPPLEVKEPAPPTYEGWDEFESGEEGKKGLRYVTTYERDPKNRRQALAIHGVRCKGCDLTMAERYGSYAEGLIHVHHMVPVSEFEAPKKVDPAQDLVPLCPNCHAVVHRKKSATLTVAQLRVLLGKA